MARQFNDDPIINYGIWGFIAGLSDYFIRLISSPETNLLISSLTILLQERISHHHHYHHHHYYHHHHHYNSVVQEAFQKQA